MSTGEYSCAQCQLCLYTSGDKWEGPCPWPSFRKVRGLEGQTLCCTPHTTSTLCPGGPPTSQRDELGVEGIGDPHHEIPTPSPAVYPGVVFPVAPPTVCPVCPAAGHHRHSRQHFPRCAARCVAARCGPAGGVGAGPGCSSPARHGAWGRHQHHPLRRVQWLHVPRP